MENYTGWNGLNLEDLDWADRIEVWFEEAFERAGDLLKTKVVHDYWIVSPRVCHATLSCGLYLFLQFFCSGLSRSIVITGKISYCSNPIH